MWEVWILSPVGWVHWPQRPFNGTKEEALPWVRWDALAAESASDAEGSLSGSYYDFLPHIQRNCLTCWHAVLTSVWSKCVAIL